MRLRFLLVVAVVMAVALTGCANREHGTITAGYGDSVISGEVMMQGTADPSPAGVQVSVRGTGMTTILGADGKFAFAGAPDGADLVFRRATDGIAASLRMDPGASHVVVALAQSSATKSSSKRRGVGRGGETVYEFEGVVRSATADQVVVFTSKGEEVTIGLNAQTVIRHGDQVLTAADLVVDARVHVKAKKDGDAYTAILVLLQRDGNGDDERPESREYAGVVKTASPDQLVITDARGNDVTFVLNAATVVRSGNSNGTVADLKAGQRVEVKASVAADGTKTATRVTIEREAEHPPEQREYEGTVKSASATSLVLESRGSEVTFVMNAATVVRNGTVADLKAGQRVQVKATVAADGTKTATRVTIKKEK